MTSNVMDEYCKWRELICLQENMSYPSHAGAFAYYLQFGEIYKETQEQIEKIKKRS